MPQGLYNIAPLEPLIESGYTVLTPNQRLARRIKAEWDARQIASGASVWQPPPVYALDSWLLRQWERAVSLELLAPATLLGPAQALELWRQVIVQHERESSDYHLLRPSAAARLASQARDYLQRWQVNTGQSAIRQLFELNLDCAPFLRWLALFEQRLAQQQLCTETDCLVQLAKARETLPPVRIALLALDDMPPLQEQVLQALGSQLLHVETPAVSSQRVVHVFSDKRSELQAVASWAATLQRTQPATTVGIVLGDTGVDRVALEYLLRREFECLGENYNSLPVNFSTGIRLSQAPLVRDALAVLSLQLPETSVPAVVALLRSPFLNLPDAHGKLALQFIRRLFETGCEMLAVDDVRILAAGVGGEEQRGISLAHHLEALRQDRELRTAAPPSQWAVRFSRVISSWGWPGNRVLDSLEYQQLDIWQQTLELFMAHDAVCDALGYADALQLLKRCCDQQPSQPQTADSPVQVLGPLEAGGLAFDELWVCSVQASAWPAAPRPNPFIPVSLQVRLQMPHASAAREWAFGERLFRQYSRSSGTLHASYCRQLDGLPEQPSALLDNFTVQDLIENSPVNVQWSNRCAAAQLETLPDYLAPPITTEQLMATRGGSSLLEDQSQCPFRAFAHHRLATRPLNTVSAGLPPSARGSLLHAALYALWGELQDHDALLALDPEGEEHLLARAVDTAITDIPYARRRRLGPAYWKLEAQHLVTLLAQWLNLERERDAFTVVAREQALTHSVGQLSLQLRVDRIDQLTDGTTLVIDYKSGDSSVRDCLGDRPAKPQLALYATAVDAASAVAFAQVRPRACRFVGLGKDAAAPGILTDIGRATGGGEQAQDWDALTQYWRDTLSGLARSFVAGDAQVSPLASTSCAWCGLQPLCRVQHTNTVTRADTE